MMVRSFIAIEVPPVLQKKITESTKELRSLLPKPLVRWVPELNIHLTLQFLGDITLSNLERLAEVIKVEASSHLPFELSVGHIGAFPSNRRARVLWIGLEAPPALPALVRSILAASAQMGYPPENRSFSPHLTIGRVNQNASAEEIRRIHAALEESKDEVIGTFRVEAVKIYKSDLTPAGSIYSCLYMLPLNKA